MAVLKLVGNAKEVYYHKVITEITNEQKKDARRIFEEYKKIGVIKSNYEDNAWEVTNEVEILSIITTFDEIEAAKKLKNVSVRELKEIFKAYLIFCFGSVGLQEIRHLSKVIRKAMTETEFFTKYPDNDNCLVDYGIQEFFHLIPGIDEMFFLENEYTPKKGNERRTLAEYESYFIFDDIINDFFPRATQKEKEKYFPIYIWWKITTVLPLRVTETLVTPYDCINNKNGKWYLKIRRSRLKGDAKCIRRYKVEKDYIVYEYEVTKEIADIINEYKKLRKKYKEPKGDALLSCEMFRETYMKNRNYKFKIDEKYISIRHMGELLRDFYIEVIGKKYNYNILEKTNCDTMDETGETLSLADNEIVKINLGDTRHIAIQNLLLSGCNILLANEITGHAEVETIFHYAGNIQNLVKCKVYSLNRKVKREKEILSYMNNDPNRVDKILNQIQEIACVNVDAGKCFSPNMVKNNDPKDCYSAGGNCECCKYFRCENINELEKIKRSYEAELEQKVKRIEMWLQSKNYKKQRKELQIQYEQFRTIVENLQTIYTQELRLKEESEGTDAKEKW